MRTAFATIAFILAASLGATPQDKAPADLSGIYQLSGQEGPDEYHGVLLLDKQDDGTYKMRVATFGGSFRGVGIRKGDILSCAWAQPSGDGLMLGLTVYAIKGKILEGEWTTVGAGKMPRTEKARWIAKLKADEI